MQQQGMARLRLLVLMVGVMLGACGGPTATGRGAPGRYAQTMDSATSACLRNPACYTQTGEEAVLPWVSRAASHVRTTVAALRVLEAAEIARVEQLLVECAELANFEVNERMLGQARRPSKELCAEVVGKDSRGNPVTRAMELGREKHRVALDCARQKLEKTVPGNFSIEPRYRYDKKTGQKQLLDPEQVDAWLRDGLFHLLLGTLMPDVVLHTSGDPLKPQAIYDFKFPCPSSKTPSWHEYPPNHPYHPLNQGILYQELLPRGAPRPGLVSPVHGISP